MITWSGAYDAAIADGSTEPEAVRDADAAVRATLGSFNPEDLSAFETGTPLHRAFTMFYYCFNVLANTLGTGWAVTIRDMGLKAGAGRLLYPRPLMPLKRRLHPSRTSDVDNGPDQLAGALVRRTPDPEHRPLLRRDDVPQLLRTSRTMER